MNRIIASTKLPKHNGWLLSVLHTTRTLDTTLSEIVASKGWLVGQPSLGRYLAILSSNGVIFSHEKGKHSDLPRR